MSTHYNEDDVRTFVQPRQTAIRADICPGCMRRKKGAYLFPSGRPSIFCDRFCEEIWRKHHERLVNASLPWEERRGSFFVVSATGIESPPEARRNTIRLSAKETAQYEPAY